jgi:single-stranded-DNA-specific exonuclease
MTQSNDLVVGSGRSQGEKNIGLLMMQATQKGILVKGGGHGKACGFTLKKENVDTFKSFLIDQTKDIEILNEKSYDSLIDVNVINDNLLKDLEYLSPFGQQNAEPIFKIEKAKIDILKIFKDKHAKLKVSDNLGFSCEGMFFDVSSTDLKNYLANRSEFNCYFKVKKDPYSDKTIIHLEDIH